MEKKGIEKRIKRGERKVSMIWGEMMGEEAIEWWSNSEVPLFLGYFWIDPEVDFWIKNSDTLKIKNNPEVKLLNVGPQNLKQTVKNTKKRSNPFFRF